MHVSEPSDDLSLTSILTGWTDVKCREILRDLLDEVPEAVDWVWERHLLENANAEKLVNAVRKDLRGCEPYQDDRDRWVEGVQVDYDRICERLKVLLEGGHVEEVVDLGPDLLRAGGHEVEHSHDNDWDIQCGVGECLKVVFQALKRSKRSLVERILWEIGMDLEDEYGLLGDREAFQSGRKPITAETWSEVADQLLDVLKNVGKGGIRHRKKIVHQIVLALRRSDRVEDLFSFLRQETGHSDCVLELGEQLILYGRIDEAVSVWMERVEQEISKKNYKGYAEAGKWLNNIRKVFLEQDRTHEWRILLADLRNTHNRKQLFMKVLDRLDG